MCNTTAPMDLGALTCMTYQGVTGGGGICAL
jgi:hypothetical protein